MALSKRTVALGAKRCIAVANKRDLPACWDAEKRLGAFPAAVRVSATEGSGLSELERAAAEAFPLPETAAGEILTNARQAEVIGRALERLRAGREALAGGWPADAVLTECEAVMEALAELTGRVVRQDVTDAIFSRFCVGK